MIKKQLLVILATIVLSFSAFAQFSGGSGTANDPYRISTREDFLAISSNSNNLSKYYIQTADIVLGDLGTLPANNAIINGTFSGTYDGGGHSISYSVKFEGSVAKESFGLFEEVRGTIKNLRITSSSAMLSGTGKDMNIGLICGLLCSNGVITDCHVTGNINSTVTPYNDNNELENGAGSDAGLIAGQSLGKIKYSSGTGNVVGVGYAGGLVGQLNDRWRQYQETNYSTNNGEIIGCSFVGSVTALKPHGDYDINNDMGNFAGGICGLVSNGGATNEISLSYANATVVSDGGKAYGLAHFSNKAENSNNSNYGSYGDIYVKGEVNDDNIDTYGEICNISSGNRYENTNHNSVEINSTLNGVVDDTDEANEKIYFSRETGEIILVFGRPDNNIATDCNPPQNLKINVWSKGNGRNKYNLYTAKWDLEESVTWVYELKKVDDGSITTSGTIYDNDSITLGVNNRTSNNGGYELLASGEYVLSVRRKCNDGVSLSDYATAAINIQNNNCSSVGDLSASDITYNSATITWEETTAGAYEFKLNDGEAETLTTNSKPLIGLTPNTLYKVEVRSVCSPNSKSLVEVIEFVTPDATVEQVPFKTIKDGNFEQPSTWNRNSVPTGNNEGTITINHEVVLNSTLTLNGNTTINIDHSNGNKGVLKIDQQGQLITTSTTNDVIGIVEILTPIIGQKKWAFLGAPFVTASDANNYKLETIMPETGSDIIVSFYEYGSRNDWSADRDVYATYQYEAKTGEGYLGFPFYDGVVSFTSYGDLWDFSLNGGAGGIKEYDATPALYKLNNSNVTITNANSNKWTPLSNPYPAKLSVSKFLSENSDKIQGGGVYKLANANASAFEIVSTGEIKMTEGFFVNLSSGTTSVNFSQTQLTAYQPTPSAKSAVEREFIELALVQNNHASKLYFAHNEQAEQGYDIFDADKLFAMTEMTEPYFVTEGKELVKEEVAELPYYATMNVRSFEHDSVSFVANNIPEGYSVSIIDGEETIELTESSAYSTLVSRGENANRFKVLIKKSVGLGEVEELEVEITNNNRLVNVSSTEEDLQIEVYNALGQKVFATKDRNFTLNNISAGAYLVKAFNNKASKTQKIVIK